MALADRLAALQDSIGFTLPHRADAPRPAADTLLALATAVRSQVPVDIDYRSWRGAGSSRKLDPYGLVFHAGRWYVAGHDHRSGEIRTFRVDRVTAVTPGTGTFVPPDGFDPVGHVSRSLAGVPYAWEVAVLLDMDPARARRRIPPSVAELSGTTYGTLLRARAERLDGMAHLLAGLGCPFTVLRPDELRIAVASHAAQLAESATRSPPGAAALAGSDVPAGPDVPAELGGTRSPENGMERSARPSPD